MNTFRTLLPAALAVALSGGPAQAAGRVDAGPSIHVLHVTAPVPPDPGAQSDLSTLPSISRPWQATWDADTGHVRMLYNGETGPSSDALETAARRFLAEHGALFGLADTSDLRRSELMPHALGGTVRFLQVYQGLRVYPGDLAVSRNREGRIYLVSSSYRPNLALDTVPRVTAADARRLAVGASGGGTPGTPELIVWAAARPARLAWQVDVTAGPEREERVLLDALRGTVISRGNLVCFANSPRGNVYLGNPISTPNTTAVSLPDLDTSGTLVGKVVSVQKFTGRDMQGGVTGTVDLRAQNGDFLLPSTNPAFNQVEMYFSINRWHTYYHDAFGFTKRDGSIPAIVGVPSPDGTALNNAFFSPGCDCMEFGLASDGTDLSLDADVIGHEYTHSVVNTLNKIGMSPDRWAEYRAMNEALADYFSSTVIGEGCVAEYAGKALAGTPCLRDLNNRFHYPEAVDQVIVLKDGTRLNTWGEEHETGQIWGGALWDLRRALGNTVADKIVFSSLPLYPDTAGFSDARVATQTADQQLKTGAADIITKVMDNRGIPTQAPFSYVRPDGFSDPNVPGSVILADINAQGGGFNTQGMLPVFVSGRTYGFTGFFTGIDPNTVKFAKLFFLPPNGQSNGPQLSVPATLATVNIQVQGQMAPPTVRFELFFDMPTGKEGQYKVGIGISADDKNYSVPNAFAGAIVKDSGPAPAPPKDVLSTPPPVPAAMPGPGMPMPPPTMPMTTPVSIQLQPQNPTLVVGDTLLFSATVTDASGQSLPNANVNWSLDDPNHVGAITSSGVLSANKAGQLAVIAGIGGVQAQTNVTITAAAAPTGTNGLTWAQAPGTEKTHVLGIAGASVPGTASVYAAGPDSIQLSSNGGRFQDVINGLDPATIPVSVAVNPANPGLVYVATLNAGLLRSTSGGQIWTQDANDLALLNFGFFPVMASVTTDAQDEVFLGTLNDGAVFRPGPQQPWLPVNNGLGSAIVLNLQFSAAVSPAVGFASTQTGAYRLRGTDTAWSSVNNGLTHKTFEGPNAELPPAVNGMALNPANPSELLAATAGDGLFISHNQGDTWQQIVKGLNDPQVDVVVYDPKVADRLFAGTGSSGVFMSTDHGQSWQPVNAGLTTGAINTLAFDPANPNRLYAGTNGEGVWMLDLSGGAITPPPIVTPPPVTTNGPVTIKGVTGAPGQTVTVEVDVDGTVQNLSEADFILQFGGVGKVDVKSLVAGTVFGGQADVLSGDDSTPGQAFIDVGNAPEKAVNGPGSLVTIPLKIDAAAAPGVYALKLTSVQLLFASGVPQMPADVVGTLTIPGAMPPPPSMRLHGDANGDNKVNISDVTLALRLAVGLIQPTPDQLAALDANGNGKVDLSDVTRLLRFVVGLSPTFF